MSELDHIREELRGLREDVSDTRDAVARLDERLANFIDAAGARARKTSDRVAAVDGRVGKLETWRWLLVGAYGAIPVVWVVVMLLKGGVR